MFVCQVFHHPWKHVGVGWKHALPESESEMYLFDPYNYIQSNLKMKPLRIKRPLLRAAWARPWGDSRKYIVSPTPEYNAMPDVLHVSLVAL